jgi:hypothetical protein
VADSLKGLLPEHLVDTGLVRKDSSPPPLESVTRQLLSCSVILNIAVSSYSKDASPSENLSSVLRLRRWPRTAQYAKIQGVLVTCIAGCTCTREGVKQGRSHA